MKKTLAVILLLIATPAFAGSFTKQFSVTGITQVPPPVTNITLSNTTTSGAIGAVVGTVDVVPAAARANTTLTVQDCPTANCVPSTLFTLSGTTPPATLSVGSTTLTNPSYTIQLTTTQP